MEYNEQDGRIQQKYKISNKTKRCFEILIFQFLLFSSVSMNWEWHIGCDDELFETLQSIQINNIVLFTSWHRDTHLPMLWLGEGWTNLN